jgi:hypothetical protein
VTWLIALAIGVAIWLLAAWAIRLLATPPPPEPDPEDVHAIAIDYRCTVCGLTLTVTAAQDGELAAPRHCREEMVATA